MSVNENGAVSSLVRNSLFARPVGARRGAVLSAAIAGVVLLAARAAQAQLTNQPFVQWDFDQVTAGTTSETMPPNPIVPLNGTAVAKSVGMSQTFRVGAATNTSGGITTNNPYGFIFNSTNSYGSNTQFTINNTAGSDVTNSSPYFGNDSGYINAWRIRASGSNGSNNGWSNFAAPLSQGVEFDAPITGFKNVNFSFQWFSTTQAVADMQVQYSLDKGVTWQNFNGNILSGSELSVDGNNTGHLQVINANAFQPNPITLDFSSVTQNYGAAGDMLQVRMLNLTNSYLASIGGARVATVSPVDAGTYLTYYASATSVANARANSRNDLIGGYNGSSGNWRFASITFSGDAQSAALIPGAPGNPNASTFYWTGSTTTFDTANSSAFRTNTGSGLASAAFVNNNDASFNSDSFTGSSQTVTIQAGGVTIGNVLAINNNAGQTYTFTNGATGGALTGSGKIVKTGGGILVLGGLNTTNTLTGGVQILGGELKLSTGTALGSGNILLDNSTITASGKFTVNTLTRVGANGVTFNTPSSSNDAQTYAATFAALTPSAITPIRKIGNGTVTFSNAFPGGTLNGGPALSLQGGTLAIGAGGIFHMYLAGTNPIANGTKLNITGGGRVNLYYTTTDPITGQPTSLYGTTLGSSTTPGGGSTITFSGNATLGSKQVSGLIADNAPNNIANPVTYDVYSTLAVSGADRSFVFGATSGSTDGSNANTLNIRNPITGALTGVSGVYFASDADKGDGVIYYYSGGNGVVNLYSKSTYSANTYVAMGKNGVVRLQVDDALPTTTRLSLGDDGINSIQDKNGQPNGIGVDVGTLDLNGFRLKVGSLAGTPYRQSFGGIVNSGSTASTLVFTGSVTSSYGASLGAPGVQTPNISNAINHNINLITDPAFTGTQTFTGSLAMSGVVSATNGKLVLAANYLPKALATAYPNDNGTSIGGTIAASGTGMITLAPPTATNSYTTVAAYAAAAPNNIGTIGADPSLITVTGSGTLQVGLTDRTSGQLPRVLVTDGSGLIRTGNARIDLTNNDMIVKGGSLSAILGQVTNGYRASTTGLSILTSASTNVGTGGKAILAVFSNNAGGGIPYFTQYDGVSLDATDVIVKFTLAGDMNLDGTVDGKDYKYFTEHLFFGGFQAGTGGDLNYDGAVDANDLSILVNNLTAGISFGNGQESTGTTSAIPEPGNIAVALLAVPALSRRRRTR
jgi:autotransporter-associated beta strand protein